jgi:hypothetical protein
VPDEVSELQKIQKDLLWGMYSDLRTHARHAEILRANAGNFVLVVSLALIAVITSDGHVNRDELPICIVVTLLGALGAAFSAAYLELFHRNRRRADGIRKHLDNRFFATNGPTLGELIAASDSDHEQTRIYRWSRRLTGSTHRFWLFAPGIIVAAGIVLTIFAI